MSKSETPLSICIIGINYAPELTGCAPYTSDLAENLAELGHEVTVVTGFPHYPQWRLADDYSNKRSHTEHINGVKVIRAKHYVPRKMNAITRGIYEFSFLMNGWWQSRALKPDIIIAISPALTDIVIGKWMKKRTGATYKILVQDLMAAAATQSSIRGGGLVSGIVERIEGSGLRAADTIAVITESFNQRVLDYGVVPNKIVISPNYSHSNITPLDRDECRLELGWSLEDFLVIHTGNMGLKQDLGNVIEAARLLADERPDIKFYLIGDGSQRAALEAQASGLANVKFFDLFSKELYPKVLGAADILLINESPDQIDMSLPSKLTAYVAAERRIIAATVEGGATHTEVKTIDGSTLVNAGNSDLLADAIIAAPLRNFQKKYGIPNNCENRAQWALEVIASS